MLLVLLLLAWPLCSVSSFIKTPCLRTVRVTLEPSSPYIFGTTYSFPITFDSPLDSVADHGINLFEIDIRPEDSYLSFDTWLDGLTTTGSNIGFMSMQPNTTFYRLGLIVVVSSGSCTDRYEILFFRKYLSLLNTASRVIGTQTLYYDSARFNLTNPNITSYTFIPYISSINVTVPAGAYYQDITLDYQRIEPDGRIAVDFRSDLFGNNSIYSVKLTIIVANLLALEASNTYWYTAAGAAGEEGYVGGVFNNTLFVGGHSLLDVFIIDPNNCTLGLFILNYSSDYRIKQTKVTYQDNFYISAMIQNIYRYNLNGICFIECASQIMQLTLGSFYYCCDIPDCQLCSDPGVCSQCSSTHFKYQSQCVSCLEYYTPNSTVYSYAFLCQTCDTYSCDAECLSTILLCNICFNQTTCVSCLQGDSVTGGCNTIPGCLQIQQVSPGTLNHTIACTLCDQSEFSLSTDGTCQCSDPNMNLVEGRCLAMPFGCLAALPIDNGTSLICATCNAQLGLSFVNGSCVCSTGYSLVEGSCSQVCGDGLVFTAGCDDANTINGDGCSSTCTVEVNYHCTGSPSTCAFINDVTLSYISIDNTGTANEGSISLSVSPPFNNIVKINFTEYANFTVNNLTFPIKQTQYLSGQLQLLFDYTQTIQGSQAVLSVSLDSNYVVSLNNDQHFSFHVIGLSRSLTYSSNSSEQQTYYLVFLIIYATYVLIAAVSLLFCDTLSIELTVFPQIIYLLYFQSSTYTSSWSYLQGLSYFMGNINYYLNQQANLVLGSAFHGMSYSSSNYMITMVCMLAIIATVASFIGLTLLINQGSKAPQFGRQSVSQIVHEQESFSLLVARRLFKYLGMNFFPFVLLQSLNQTQSEGSSLKLIGSYFGIAFRLVLIYLVVMAAACNFFKDDRTAERDILCINKAYTGYLGAYVIVSSYIFGTLIIPSLNYSQKYLILVTSLLFLIYQCRNPSSSHTLHNILSLVFTLIVLVFSLLLIVRELSPSMVTESNDRIIVIVFMAVLIIVATLSAIVTGRMAYMYYQHNYLSQEEELHPSTLLENAQNQQSPDDSNLNKQNFLVNQRSKDKNIIRDSRQSHLLFSGEAVKHILQQDIDTFNRPILQVSQELRKKQIGSIRRHLRSQWQVDEPQF